MVHVECCGVLCISEVSDASKDPLNLVWDPSDQTLWSLQGNGFIVIHGSRQSGLSLELCWGIHCYR